MTRPTPRATTSRLPKSARQRLERSDSTAARTSFLTVPAAYGVRAAGLEPVGDVMGCIAFRTGFEYLGSCGVKTRITVRNVVPTSDRPRVTFASSTGSGATSYLTQLSTAYRTALDRLRAEAKALGADGVLGTRLELEQHDDLREIVAIGTAVRSTGRTRPSRLFTTDLSGDDVAKLLLSGWAPATLHVAVELGLRHVDAQTVRETSAIRSNTNREVTGYTDLRQQVTQRVGEQLRRRVAGEGADGALLAELRFRQWHRHCMTLEGSGDLVGLATATGTSVVRFAAPSTPPPAPLRIMPLGRRPQ